MNTFTHDCGRFGGRVRAGAGLANCPLGVWHVSWDKLVGLFELFRKKIWKLRSS